MPKWGLTQEQRRAKPWGLSESILQPYKVITDPVHGDVFLSRLEVACLDSPPMQRLRGVRQLGTTHLVYPGATHVRFSHAIGALRVAQDLLDAVLDNRNSAWPIVPDYFDEIRPNELDSPDHQLLAHHRSAWEEYNRKVGEIVVLARLGALLHDLCHVPFGHTIEDDLQVLDPHDSNTERFERLWAELRPVKDGHIKPGSDLETRLRTLILSKEPLQDGQQPNPSAQVPEYPFVVDIVGNTICADLIDYIKRDHLFTGLPLALGDRFMSSFFVSSGDEPHYPNRMIVRVSKNGVQRVDIITELLKYLRYRYELSERVLNHHAKIAADAMVGKLLEMWRDWLTLDEAHRLDPHVFFGPSDDLAEVIQELKNRRKTVGGKRLKAFDLVQQRAKARIEQAFTTFSDDGLLQWLAAWGEEASVVENGRLDDRRIAVGKLARAVLNRELFKLVGRADTRIDRANAEKIYAQYKHADARRQLEQKAALYVGVKPSWQVVLWVPTHKMRLKPAEVLVEQEGRIAPLTELDSVQDRRAREIYDAHQSLWAVSVYMGRDVQAAFEKNPLKRKALLAYLGKELGVTFRTRQGEVVGDPIDVAVAAALDKGYPRMDKRQALRAKFDEQRAAARAGSSGDSAPTFDELVDELDRLKRHG